ncbi:MAG TPA: succinyl-diaminopimelate desuccinylase [Caulobacteraceae bacterium]|nr:succinyl-diaminopimelate desuccinylase [Caulobacteraceae bacterium]
MTNAMAPDAVELARALIRAPSVTPVDAGAMDIVQNALEPLGFSCRRMSSGGIENLYARFGSRSPNFCFAGHTDVVPPGDVAAWRFDPFAAQLEDGVLFGRGAADMKSAIAAFIAAAGRLLAKAAPPGSISLIITGDEEGIAEYGTKAVVEALSAEGEVIDHCLVGEPTSAEELGDMIKVGRRGSLSAHIEVAGVQGHTAYPHRAANPVRPLLKFLAAVEGRRLDDGWPSFPPSNLEITTIDVGNPATNVIPGNARAALNIRFNPTHTGAALCAWLDEEAQKAGAGFSGRITLESRISGEPFLTEPGAFTALAAGSVEAVCGRAPELSTTGGTSDARFIRVLCPVVELGLVGTTMHKVDECVPAAEIVRLSEVYERLLADYFASPPGSSAP